MDRDMERIAMESNAYMVESMLGLCREKTIKKSHGTGELTADEKKQFQNCISKFFEAPQVIMASMQQQMGGGQF